MVEGSPNLSFSLKLDLLFLWNPRSKARSFQTPQTQMPPSALVSWLTFDFAGTFTEY